MGRMARVVLARGTDRFGRTGWAGLALSILAALWLAQSWRQHQAGLPARSAEAVATAPYATPPSAKAAQSKWVLPKYGELALLLTQIQQIAVSQGLTWSAADYKLLPSSETVPASLEVRCTLRGGYPKLRTVLTQWLQQVPGIAIRGLAMSRPNSDAAEVEAKLHLVIFMRGDTLEGRP
jgi:hypothetical protein